MSHCYAPCRSALTLKNRLLFNSFFVILQKNKNMISNSPEYLIEEVMNQYGIEVPMETVLTYLDSDPYLTPESLYDYVTRYGEEENITAIKLKGYKFIDFEKNYNDIPLSKGVYIWLLKDNSVLPAINGIHPSFTWVEANGSRYRVLYVGLAEKESLFERINNFHLKGNPRSSTLCYSIGAILGLPLYGKIEKSGKRRIHLEQEKWEEIRNWLIQNCYILVKPQNNPTIEERNKIALFSAPINIKDNPCMKSDPYVVALQQIRKQVKELDSPVKNKGCLCSIAIFIIANMIFFL